LKFGKKPVIIEAVKWTGDNYKEMQNFTRDNSSLNRHIGGDEKGNGFPQMYEELIIHTLEGDFRVSKGDWIIKGIKGEFYLCKPDIFQQTYEKVNEGTIINKIV